MQYSQELLTLLVDAKRVSKILENNKDLTLLLNNKEEVGSIKDILNLDKEMRSMKDVKNMLYSRKVLSDQLEFNKKSRKGDNILSMYESAIKGIDEGINFFIQMLSFQDREISNISASFSEVIARHEKAKRFLNLFGYPFARITLMEKGTLKLIEDNIGEFAGMPSKRIIALDKMMYEIRTKLGKVPTTIEELKTLNKELT